MAILTEPELKQKIALKRLRIAAALIDLFVYWASGFIVGVILGRFYIDSEGIGVHLKGFPGFVVMLMWFPLIPISEGLTGQTIGKRLAKIKVVKQNLAPANIGTSLLRHLFDIIDLFFFAGLIVASGSTYNKRTGDWVAGTLVIMKD